MFAGQSEPSAKNEPDFQRFENFMKRLVAVPTEIKAALDAEKKAKKQKRASRASSGTR